MKAHKKLITTQHRKLTTALICDYDIAEAVLEACETKFRIIDLREKVKSKRIAEARHVAMYTIRKMTELSYPEIGDFLNRDPSTAIHSCRVVESSPKLLDRSAAIQALVSRELEAA